MPFIKAAKKVSMSYFLVLDHFLASYATLRDSFHGSSLPGKVSSPSSPVGI